MKSVMLDTSSSVEAFYHRKLMERSPEERFMMGIRMFETARSMALASLPANLSPGERFFNLFQRFYGHEFDNDTLNQVGHRIFKLFSTEDTKQNHNEKIP